MTDMNSSRSDDEPNTPPNRLTVPYDALAALQSVLPHSYAVVDRWAKDREGALSMLSLVVSKAHAVIKAARTEAEPEAWGFISTGDLAIQSYREQATGTTEASHPNSLRNAVEVALADFEMINESGMWAGHPFNHTPAILRQALKDTQPETTPRVKALEWKRHDGVSMIAETMLGPYIAEPHRAWVPDDEQNCRKILPGDPVTLEEAQAACQEDYERRVLSALEVG